MANLSVRLPDEVERSLETEAALSHMSRSDVVREAITEYVARRERERFMQSMVSAARALAADSDAIAESVQMADDLADEGMDTIAETEAAENSSRDKWWV